MRLKAVLGGNLVIKYLKIVCIGLFLLTPLYMTTPSSADNIKQIKQKFHYLGGSKEGFNKLLLVMRQMKKNNDMLSIKIKNIYSNQLVEIIKAPDFDASAYSKVFNLIIQSKETVMRENLKNSIALMNTFSHKDKKAYLGLIYSKTTFDQIIPKQQVGGSTLSNKLSISKGMTKKPNDVKATMLPKQQVGGSTLSNKLSISKGMTKKPNDVKATMLPKQQVGGSTLSNKLSISKGMTKKPNDVKATMLPKQQVGGQKSFKNKADLKDQSKSKLSKDIKNPFADLLGNANQYNNDMKKDNQSSPVSK